MLCDIVTFLLNKSAFENSFNFAFISLGCMCMMKAHYDAFHVLGAKINSKIKGLLLRANRKIEKNNTDGVLSRWHFLRKSYVEMNL